MEHSIFWCKVNKFYLNKWLWYFSQRGFDETNAHLMATCVVTDRAKWKWVKAAKKLLKQWKDVYLTWCGAFEKWEAMDYEKFYGIYPSLRQWHKQLTLLGEDPAQQTDLWTIWEYELNREMEQSVNLYTKKFIVIQSGCDTFCTFCLTIYKRGSQRNRSAEEIIDEIHEFVQQWGKEIVITWVNLASRWATNTRKPEENKFSDLLERILSRTKIERIRISSLWPEFLDEKFYELMQDTRFLPHFHVSIQHFDSHVLKRMNRNYDFAVLEDVLTNLRGLKRADRDYISIGADLIVGFPDETEQRFQFLLDCVERFRITKLHAFPFSPHQKWETVPAGRFDWQIPTAVKKERMQRLLQLGEQVRQDFEAINTWIQRDVLVEEKKDGLWTWRTPNYLPVSMRGNYSRWQVVPFVIW